MKFKIFTVLTLILAATVFAISCGEDETTTAESVETTTAAATTTVATTTAATTTAATTTAATTTAATTKATTAATTKATTVATTTAATTTAATTTAATTTVAPVANSPKSPSKLPGGAGYTSVVIFDGNKESYSMSCNDKENSSVDITTLPNGNKVFAYHLAADYKYGALGELDYEITGNEKGLLFYMDASDTGSDTHPRYGLLLRIGSVWYQVGSKANDIMNAPDTVHNYAYYFEDGSNEWVKTENYDNCRVVLTNQFKGWIYVPFTQLSQNGGNAQSLTDYIIAFPGECELDSVMFYVGNVNKAEGAESSDLYFDNFLIVTAK